jgi:xanthine dehydrogenase YagR molybdenum-binding subunit
MSAAFQEDQKPGGQVQMPQRYDGRLKVMGKATYAAEFPVKDVAHAYIIQSTIPSGIITSMDTTAAERASGVLAVLTPFNTNDANPAPPPQPPTRRALSVLQSKEVHYSGEPIGVVVAKTLVEAQHAATLVRVNYRATSADLDFEGRLNIARPPKQASKRSSSTKGDMEKASQNVAVFIEETYTTPIQNHNPMEPHGTIAVWDGDKLTVYDSTQYISGCRTSLAKVLGIPTDNVRVVCPFVGGGFGSKGSMWSHVPLAAIAAKKSRRPVKLVLDRTQMFGPVGARPRTVQKIKLGSTRDGNLMTVQHDVILHTSKMEDFLEPAALCTTMLYDSEAISMSHKMVELNLGVATFQRAPGEAVGTPALESAMDELAYKLKMDPLEFRLKNYADKDPTEDKPFTSKNLKLAYQQAAERFGWSKRPLEPRSMKEGGKLIGWGMGTATYPANRSAAQAAIQVMPDGKVTISSGTQDLGTGMYTIMAQAAAEPLGIDPKMVTVKLGDSSLPNAPVSGGSQSTASVSPAVRDAALQALLKIAQMASDDSNSPLNGVKPSDVEARNGMLSAKGNPNKSVPLITVLKNGGKTIEAKGAAEPGQEKDASSAHSWGATFAEVEVDEALGHVKVRRIVATYDIGKLLNKTTGINQLHGGIVWGIGVALREATEIDPVYGRTVNENLAEYHVPVNADVPQLDVTVLDIPDEKFQPLGGRGIGEIGITGVSGAIANAIWHATGKRVRDFPITVDKLLT